MNKLDKSPDNVHLVAIQKHRLLMYIHASNVLDYRCTPAITVPFREEKRKKERNIAKQKKTREKRAKPSLSCTNMEENNAFPHHDLPSPVPITA